MDLAGASRSKALISQGPGAFSFSHAATSVMTEPIELSGGGLIENGRPRDAQMDSRCSVRRHPARGGQVFMLERALGSSREIRQRCLVASVADAKAS